MAAVSDAKGYYRRLGLAPSATAEEIKAAYKQLAKKLHPDRNSSSTAEEDFKLLNEAFSILGDAKKRASYDSANLSAPESKDQPRFPEPIKCSKCGRVTAQPRYAVFRYVVSFLLATTRHPIQGIYCTSCARSSALRASLISAVAGWWGVPWGPIYTLGDIFTNATGGYEPPGSRDKLWWLNALAFTGKGDYQLAYALASQLRTASDEEIAFNALHLMETLRSRGLASTAQSLRPMPRSRPVDLLIHAGLAFGVPIALIIALSNVPNKPAWQTTSAPPAETPVDFSSSNSVATGGSDGATATSPPAPSQPACATPPENGTVFEENWPKPSYEKAHTLQISSGTDAIIKVRDAASNSVMVEFWVAANQTATYDRIPDGEYRIQYAFGDHLAASCTQFSNITGAAEFPGTHRFETTRTEDERGVEVFHQSLSYTLYGVPNGNVSPNAIDAATFNSP